MSSSAVLTEAVASAALVESGATGWSVVDGCLRQEFTFADFSEAWAFMSQVALLAEASSHHPNWSNVWNRVVIELVSHDVGGITARDISLAAAISRLG